MPKKRLEYIGHIHEDDGTVHEVYREISFAERFVKVGVIAMCVISLMIASLAVVSICLR